MEADDYVAIMNLASKYSHALDDCEWDALGAVTLVGLPKVSEG